MSSNKTQIPPADSPILREQAINHFKHRFPAYKDLNCYLEEGGLCIAVQTIEAANYLKLQAHEILVRSMLAIGVQQVRILIKGYPFLTVSACSGDAQMTVALSELPETNLPPSQDNPVFNLPSDFNIIGKTYKEIVKELVAFQPKSEQDKCLKAIATKTDAGMALISAVVKFYNKPENAREGKDSIAVRKRRSK